MKICTSFRLNITQVCFLHPVCSLQSAFYTDCFSYLISNLSQDFIYYKLSCSFLGGRVGLWSMSIPQHKRKYLCLTGYFFWLTKIIILQLQNTYVTNLTIYNTILNRLYKVLLWGIIKFHIAVNAILLYCSNISFCMFLRNLFPCTCKFHSETKWFRAHVWSPEDGDPIVRRLRILVNLLRCITLGFWSRLECSRQSATNFSCQGN